MPILRTAVGALCMTLITLAVCKRSAPRPDAPTAPRSADGAANASAATTPSSPSSGRHAPMTCQRDADCRPPPCGPCASGATVSRADLDRECVANACGPHGAVVYCNHHVCTVR